MEKRLRAALRASPDGFLSTASKLGLKSAKSSLKTLIPTVSPSSDLSSSLPLALHSSISCSIKSFRKFLSRKPPSPARSPPSPPTKRPRRSARNSKPRAEPDAEDHGSTADQGKERVLQDLQVLAHVLNLCVSHPKNAFPPADLLPAVRALHDNLILFESDSVLLSEIATLCEAWWKEGLPERETLISQSLPCLLSRSLTLGKKVDVHRVYVLREAFTLFDFEDESIEDLKLLLVRCVIAPLYLKTDEGRRFVAFMFGLNRQLLREALAMIRAQIPFGRKSMLEAYADIVFRAWKAGEDAACDEIGNVFLQGLIDGAIHASSTSLAASIRRVLGGFITQRTTEGVEKLLFRLTEPVIFRSLQVANSNVRLNALHLLLDMFPLEDPDATKEVKDTLLEKQFFLLERLLMDECPDVRVVAVEGSCRILHLFWEIIAPSSITKVLTKIFDDMSHDKCNEVRLSTLNGIIYLLGNPQSHEILKVLLPRFGHLILDSALSIRVAVVDLLLLLRDIRSFQFHKVVDMDTLLLTLASDRSLMAEKITRLLIPSYFPSKVGAEVACERCLILIKRSPLAGARFCEFALSEGASLKYLMELLQVFISLVMSPDKLTRDQMEGVLIAAGYVCSNLASEEKYKAALKDLFSGQKLKCLLAAAATERAKSSVLDIISKLCHDDGSELIDECLVLVTSCSNLSENVERQSKVRSVHNLTLSCGKFDAMLEALTRVLQKTASECQAKFGMETPNQSAAFAKLKRTNSSFKNSAKSRQSKVRKTSKAALSKFEEDYSTAAGVAWQIKELLIYENSSKSILESEFLGLAFFALKNIAEASILQCIHFDYMDTSPVVAYVTLALYINVQKVCISGADNGRKHGSAGPSTKGMQFDRTLDHLLKCGQQLIGAFSSREFSKLSSKVEQEKKQVRCLEQKHGDSQPSKCSLSATGSTFTAQRRLLSAVKMLTVVLKSIVDAASLGLVSHRQEKCLMFTSAYVQFVTCKLGQYFHCEEQIKGDLEEILLCCKSSFTYAAKLLNLVLSNTTEASPPPQEAYHLANDLLDLITSAELYLGSRYAARLVVVVKPWLPDLVLALGSGHTLKPIPDEGAASSTAADSMKLQLPSWSSNLAKSELCELKVSDDQQADRASKSDESVAFKKFIGMMVQLLKGNYNVLDTVGVVILNVTAVGLEIKDFGLVLGLIHFVCVKLVGQEQGTWRELSMMLASLPNIYPKLERNTEELGSGDDNHNLQGAKALLEPAWMYYTYGNENDPMMEE